jgi:hypothetical protein
MTGVLQQEKERAQRWADRGLPDPIKVLDEERATRWHLHDRTWQHPARAELTAYFAQHPETKPNSWDELA